MLKDKVEILRQGDQSGNGMVFKTTSSNGLEVFGLATRNFYGGNWDLGPTWNYLVLADEPFLVDTGRTGTSSELREMTEITGFDIKGLHAVVLSHGHEDHDGGLADIVKLSGARVKAHPIYDRLIKLMPDKVPDGINKDFPPSCWHCVMPPSFTDNNCRNYHQNRHNLLIENICEDTSLGQNIEVIYLPGHSPDAIAVIIDSQIAIAGDNVLPHISPAPTKMESFDLVGRLFPDNHLKIQQAFGLEAYLKSLKTLKNIGENHPRLLVLPGHRLYYNDQWNDFQMETRAQEILEHHIQRCADILKIIKKKPKTIKEIMAAHFDPSLLEGMGSYMAKNEIQSHLELLAISLDIEPINGAAYIATGEDGFESYIRSLKPWS